MRRHANLGHRIVKASMLVGIAHVLFKLAGLIQAKLMGHCLPQATYDIVYAFAFENVIFMLFLVGEEVIGPPLLPLFMREREGKDERSAWSFVNTVLTLQFIVLIALAAVLCCFPEWVTRILTHWGPDNAPEKFALAVKSLRTMGPAVIGLSLGTTTYVLLNGYKWFFLAALGDAAWKFAAIAFLVAGVVFHRDAAHLLMWGLAAGAFCKVGTHLFGLRSKLSNIRPELAFSHPAFKKFCWLALPLLAGIIVAKVRDIVNNVYILSALEQSGLMQANSMGRKLFTTLHLLVPYTLSIAVFPFFCELAGKDNRKLGELLTRMGRSLLVVFVPLAVFVAVAAVPLTALVFKGGHFDSVAVQRTAVSLACYTFVLPGAALEALLMRAFFANHRMAVVTVIGVVFSLLSIGVSWIGLKVSGGNELLLLGFIAGGFTLARTLKCVTLVELLKKNAPVFPFLETTSFLARVSIAAGLAFGAAWVLLYRVGAVAELSGRVGDMLKLGIAGAVFGVVYLGAAYGLHIGEMRELFVLVRDKVRRKSATA